MAQYSLSSVQDLFKIKYAKRSENVYNSATVTLGRSKKSYNFVGKKMEVSVPLSFAGGVGSGLLPTANPGKYDMAEITRKKIYSTIKIDRESMKASMESEGAFVQMTKEATMKGVESYNRNVMRMLYNKLDNGALGYFSGNAAGTASAPILTITSASWQEPAWEEGDYVNVNSLTSVWEVTNVDPATKAITLSRISGSDDLTAIGAGTHKVYMQNSKDSDILSIHGVLSATSGSLYGIPVARRWKSFQKDAAGGGVTTDLLNEVMLGVEKSCGKVPNLIVCPYEQFRKILNSLEDQKQYSLEPRAADLKGKVSFKGVEFMSSAGPVALVTERFAQIDSIYFINDNYLELHHAPDFGWFDDDGTVLMRARDGSDAYEGSYGGYKELYIPPTFHGILSGLAV